jgi:hypothetical protein
MPDEVQDEWARMTRDAVHMLSYAEHYGIPIIGKTVVSDMNVYHIFDKSNNCCWGCCGI